MLIPLKIFTLRPKKALDILDQKENICLGLIADNCEDYTNNEAYIESLDSYDSAVLDWIDILSAESVRSHGGSIPVKDDQKSDNVVQAMLTQMKVQNDRMESQSAQI